MTHVFIGNSTDVQILARMVLSMVQEFKPGAILPHAFVSGVGHPELHSWKLCMALKVAHLCLMRTGSMLPYFASQGIDTVRCILYNYIYGVTKLVRKTYPTFVLGGCVAVFYNFGGILLANPLQIDRILREYLYVRVPSGRALVCGFKEECPVYAVQQLNRQRQLLLCSSNPCEVFETHTRRYSSVDCDLLAVE